MLWRMEAQISRSPGLRSTKKRKKIVYGRIMPSKAGRSNLVIRVSGRQSRISSILCNSSPNSYSKPIYTLHSFPFVFWVWEMNLLVPCLCIGCTMEGDIWLLPELLGIPDPSNLLLDLKEVIIISLGSGGTDGHAERIVSKGSRERNIVKVNNDIAETGESRKGMTISVGSLILAIAHGSYKRLWWGKTGEWPYALCGC